MQILLTANKSSTKSMQDSPYNPIPKTKTLLLTMAKGDPGMTLTSTDWKSTITITKDTFPKTKAQFKKFFTCEWQKGQLWKQNKFSLDAPLMETKHSTILSTWKNQAKLLNWLHSKKEFLEADTLGIGTTTNNWISHQNPSPYCKQDSHQSQISKTLWMLLSSIPKKPSNLTTPIQKLSNMLLKQETNSPSTAPIHNVRDFHWNQFSKNALHHWCDQYKVPSSRESGSSLQISSPISRQNGSPWTRQICFSWTSQCNLNWNEDQHHPKQQQIPTDHDHHSHQWTTTPSPHYRNHHRWWSRYSRPGKMTVLAIS